jgi:hypothetical protein
VKNSALRIAIETPSTARKLPKLRATPSIVIEVTRHAFLPADHRVLRTMSWIFCRDSARFAVHPGSS